MRVSEFYDAMDAIAPFSTAESWDNVGLLVGNRAQEVSRVLLALDMTEAVLDEAKAMGAELVITHHPILFSPLKTLDSHSLIGKTLAAGIAVISAHTNLDLAQGGVNDALAQRLKLTGVRPFVQEQSRPYTKVAVFVPAADALAVCDAMTAAGAGTLGNYAGCSFMVRGEGRFLPLEGADPAIGTVGAPETVDEVRLEMICPPDKLAAVLSAMRAAHPYEEPAFDVLHNYALTHSLSLGRVGELEMPMQAEELARFTKAQLGTEGVRYTGCSRAIETVAVCGGAGGDLLGQAKAMGAQALVTGEVKHHQLLEADALDIALIDAGHFATETVAMVPLRAMLLERLPDADIRISACCTDGARYV